MRLQHALTTAAFAAILGALIAPALAQPSGGSATMPDRGMGMGGMGQGMMSRGMMSGTTMRMMNNCAGMMQSMNNGSGQPNSQWQKYRPADRSMPD